MGYTQQPSVRYNKMGPIDAESKIWKKKLDHSSFLSFDLFRSYTKKTYVQGPQNEQQLSYLIDWRDLKIMIFFAHTI